MKIEDANLNRRRNNEMMQTFHICCKEEMGEEHEHKQQMLQRGDRGKVQTHLLYSTLLVFIYLLLSYTNTQWVLKCMISPYNLGEGSVICAKTHSYQNSQKLRMAHTLSNTQKIWTKYNSYIYPEAPKVQRIPPPPKIKIQR